MGVDNGMDVLKDRCQVGVGPAGPSLPRHMYTGYEHGRTNLVDPGAHAGPGPVVLYMQMSRVHRWVLPSRGIKEIPSRRKSA